MRTLKLFLLFISPVLCLLFGASRVYAVVPAQSPRLSQNLANAGLWDGYPDLKRACSCESWGDPNKEPRQFDAKGSVIVGYPNPHDIGACQISTQYWGAKSIQLGFNLYTLAGNVAMAKYILAHQGIEAWKWSEGCWK